MVETRAQVMANEKIECLEQKLDKFQGLMDQMQKFMDQFKLSALGLHLEAHGSDEDLEGESSYHIPSMEITNIPTLALPSWTCINLMALIR